MAPIGSNWDLDELLVQVGNLLMRVRAGKLSGNMASGRSPRAGRPVCSNYCAGRERVGGGSGENGLPILDDPQSFVWGGLRDDTLTLKQVALTPMLPSVL